MKRLLIIALLLLLLLCLAVFLMPAADGKAKTKVPEISFEDQIKDMIKSHKIMTNRLIAAWEFRQEEINLLAEVIYHENWHTDKDKRAAYLTGAVVMNRVNRDDSWLHLKGNKTVYDVVYARGQYSTTKLFYTKEIPQECYDMARDIYLNGTPDVPADVIFQATFKQGPKYDVINGEWFCFG